MTRRSKTACAIFLLCVTTAIAAPAQTLTTLFSFDGTNGSNPEYMALVQGIDGSFYGTTSAGGTTGNGTVFKITSTGTLTTLYNFCSQSNCTDGDTPYAGLVQGTDGNFYGTTYGGGADFTHGTVFKITPGGVLTTLHSFSYTDGAYPYAGLIQAANGNFYGTTSRGANGYGTAFMITPQGTFTSLYSFCAVGNCSDGSTPYAGLVQATDGNFYGTTSGGGSHGGGIFFKLTPGGVLTTLYNFCALTSCADGSEPFARLVQATDGKFYGTTAQGGTHNAGTVFNVTAGGTLSTLYSFCTQTGCTDGGIPYAGLAQATDGNFYGAATSDGAHGDGVIFEITSAGAMTTLHSFDITDGDYPTGGLLQATDGNFYGTTNKYGANVQGTVFSLATGLSPFVIVQPTSGKVGATVIIQGTNLTGATAVTFGSTTAKFTVVSGSEIKTSVPAGATTALVSVTTPAGTLKSNRKFLVVPQVLSFTPPSGPVGTVVTITGVSLTQTVGVGFGDLVPAKFTVNSDTKVTATVPTGAKTGPVGAKTPGGIGISTSTFTVTP